MTRNNTSLIGFDFKFSFKNSNRVIAVFAASLLLMALIPALIPSAMAAESATYLGESTYYLNEFGSTTSVSADVIDSASAMPSTLMDGWYILKDGFTCPDRVVVDGVVYLILGDGCDVVIDGGIEVNVGNSLTIYAQSLDENVMGKLTATAKSYSYDAGIGGSSGVACGSVTICGGIVDATGFSSGAGIGGGGINHCDGGVITISGGKVVATGGDHGAGIGGGTDGNCGTIVICGDADVTATGGSCGAGIGGGQDDYAYSDHTAGGTITISGGKVVATGGMHGAGIGGGSEGDGGTIVICGDADVTATGGYGSAGIGGGHYGDSGDVFVYGENVVVSASGGEDTIEDIGAGRQPASRDGNVFALLPSSQLTKLDAAQNVVPSGNSVTFSASYLTADDVTVVLPSPFDVAPFVDANPLVVTSGLGSVVDGKAKDFSVITTFTAVDEIVFSLVGYDADPPVSTGQSLQVFGAEVKFVKLDADGEVVHIYPDANPLTEPLTDYNLSVGKASDLSVMYDSAYKVSEVTVEKYGTITYLPGPDATGTGYSENVLIGSTYTIKTPNEVNISPTYAYTGFSSWTTDPSGMGGTYYYPGNNIASFSAGNLILYSRYVVVASSVVLPDGGFDGAGWVNGGGGSIGFAPTAITVSSDGGVTVYDAVGSDDLAHPLYVFEDGFYYRVVIEYSLPDVAAAYSVTYVSGAADTTGHVSK